MNIGVLLDEPKIVPGFDYVFYEVKPASGRILQALPKAWNVVNCFADNTISQTKPNLIATFKGDRYPGHASPFPMGLDMSQRGGIPGILS